MLWICATIILFIRNDTPHPLCKCFSPCSWSRCSYDLRRLFLEQHLIHLPPFVFCFQIYFRYNLILSLSQDKSYNPKAYAVNLWHIFAANDTEILIQIGCGSYCCNVFSKFVWNKFSLLPQPSDKWFHPVFSFSLLENNFKWKHFTYTVYYISERFEITIRELYLSLISSKLLRPTWKIQSISTTRESESTFGKINFNEKANTAILWVVCMVLKTISFGNLFKRSVLQQNYSEKESMLDADFTV